MAGVQILAVIPARYHSSRLPGKPLLQIGAQCMIERVYRRVLGSQFITRTVIATDDSRIFDAAKAFGAIVFMTDPGHPSGTDRVAEVARHFPDAGIVVNVQGDEPFIEPQAVDQAIAPLLGTAAAEGPLPVVSTLRIELRDANQAQDPNVVKVVTDSAGRALYFSRARIPYQRDANEPRAVAWFKHVGLYAYRRDFLLAFPGLPRGPLERLEKLEQLRVLENGYAIQVVETTHDSIGVDTVEDLELARRRAAEEEGPRSVVRGPWPENGGDHGPQTADHRPQRDEHA